jgi:hypothetical protein
MLQPAQKQSLVRDSVKMWQAHLPSVDDPAVLEPNSEVEDAVMLAREVSIESRLRAMTVPAWELVEPEISADVEKRHPQLVQKTDDPIH